MSNKPARRPRASSAKKPAQNPKSSAKPIAKVSAKHPPTPRQEKPGPHAALFGVGLDNDDGHKRLTTGEQFAIVGGSAETHERMTETAVKTFEELKLRGKHLSEVERAELAEILHKSAPR